MAQTGYTPILLYSSTTPSQAPAAGNLTNSTFGSELAINITDGKLFYKDNTNAVQVIAWKTTPTTAGGTGLTSYTAGDLPYYATGTTLSKLAIGSSGQILTSTGTAPQWSTLSSVAVTTFSAGTTGFTPSVATSGAVTLAGTLITTNGGTGLSSYTAGDLTYYASGTTLTKLAIGVSGRWLGSSGTAPQWNAPAALTKTDDTNVTLTLGGSASTALLNAASITVGWTGQLAVSRGGTGISAFGTGVATALGQNVTGSGGIVLETNPSFTSSVGSGIGTNTRTIALVSTATAGVGVGPAISFNGNTGNSTSPYGFGGIQGVKESAAANNYAGSLLFLVQNAGGASAYDQAMRIWSSTGVSIGNNTDPGATNLSVNGNVVIATSGKGIDFSATAGTGTSELLADYEEGTWDPIIGGSVGSAGQVYAQRTGRYTKIGRMVNH